MRTTSSELLTKGSLRVMQERVEVVDFGGWSIRNWRSLAVLTCILFVGLGGLAGSFTDYRNYFSALGGPNGVLFDLTLKVAQPWRRNIPTMPAVFVAIDDESLSDPELAALPRALFQPVWARLIDGLLEAGARRIAFDVVFAYAGADFQVGSFTLPDYDRSLIDSLQRARDRIVLGRFPAFLRRFPSSRQQGHHGSEFSTSSLNQMEECEAPRPLSGWPTAVSHWASLP